MDKIKSTISNLSNAQSSAEFPPTIPDEDHTLSDSSTDSCTFSQADVQNACSLLEKLAASPNLVLDDPCLKSLQKAVGRFSNGLSDKVHVFN